MRSRSLHLGRAGDLKKNTVMLPFRSILCPVDFSAHAAHALRHAAALAGSARAKLTVAWVTDPLLARAAAVYALDPKGDQAREDLHAFVTESLPSGASPQLNLVLAVGAPEEEIVRIAREEQVDLIVMGTHGLSGYKKMFFGSTTERVLRQAVAPVLAVPVSDERSAFLNAEQTRADIKTVVVAIDLGEQSAALAAFGGKLARALGAKPVFVHVVARGSAPGRWQPTVEAHQRSVSDRAREELSRLAGEIGDGAEAVVSTGHPADEIASLVTTRRAGLIVMGLVGKTGLLGAKPGSIASRVLILAPAPVLVVPPAALSVKA